MKRTVRYAAVKHAPGTRVRFTPYFRRATSQAADPQWLVLVCTCELCARGKHVAVNEPAPADPFGRNTIAWGSPWRHIHVSNIETVGDAEPPQTPRIPTPVGLMIPRLR